MWDDPRKMICPDCNGNGYLGSSLKPEEQKDCDSCNNQGEVYITKENLDKLEDPGQQKDFILTVKMCGNF